MFKHTLPEDNRGTRDALYRGDVLLLPGTPTSKALAAEVREALEEALGPDPRRAQFELSGDEFFARCGRLRKRFYGGARYHEAIQAMLGELDFDPAQIAIEPIRLRIVAHGAAEDPKAAPVYYGHRDTWYAHPQQLVTWWIPIHDLEARETFEFLPEYFDREAPNDSEKFDYDTWLARDTTLKVGWQNPDAGREALYPRLLDELPEAERRGFSCKAGQLMLFSGSHLHQTRPNWTHQTRFSLDFRTVHLGDRAEGRGAPNPDNRSSGSALQDYLMPPGAASP